MEQCPTCQSKVVKQADKRLKIMEYACTNCDYYTTKDMLKTK